MIFSHFILLYANVRSGKRKHFYGRPRATLTSLRHCSRACGGILPRWFKVNLICAKKSITLIGLNMFFLCVNSRITSKIFKICFGQSEQVWMVEKLVTILLFEIQSSAFVFLNL